MAREQDMAPDSKETVGADEDICGNGLGAVGGEAAVGEAGGAGGGKSGIIARGDRGAAEISSAALATGSLGRAGETGRLGGRGGAMVAETSSLATEGDTGPRGETGGAILWLGVGFGVGVGGRIVGNRVGVGDEGGAVDRDKRLDTGGGGGGGGTIGIGGSRSSATGGFLRSSRENRAIGGMVSGAAKAVARGEAVGTDDGAVGGDRGGADSE